MRMRGSTQSVLAIQKLMNRIRNGINIEWLVENKVGKIPDYLFDFRAQLAVDAQENDRNLQTARAKNVDFSQDV